MKKILGLQSAMVCAVLVASISAQAYLVPGFGSGDAQPEAVGSIGVAPNGGFGGPSVVPADPSPYDPVQVPAPIYGHHGGMPQPGYPQYGGYQGGGQYGGGMHQQQGQLNERRLIRLIYRAALMREADAGGLNHFSNYIVYNGYAGLIQAARDIGNSQEMQEVIWRNGARRVVNNIYRVFFNRFPDPGAEGWVRMLEQGQAGEALAGIVGSQEFSIKQLQ